MPTIYCLAGVSGAGKTYTRTKNPELKGLPYLDVADCYEKQPGMGPHEAWFLLENELVEMLDQGGDLVVEAWFRRDGFQRARIELLAQANGYRVEWIELEADREICKQRVEQDFHNQLVEHPEKVEELLSRRDARLRLLDIAAW